MIFDMTRRVSGGGGGPTTSDAILTVTVPSGSTVTMTKGGVTLLPTMWVQAADNTLDCALFVISPILFDAQNAWTVTASLSGDTVSATVKVDSNKQYDLELSFRVPSQYKIVEYIQTSGTQYIDTGVPARSQIRCIIDGQCTSSTPLNQTLLGGNGSQTQNNVLVIGFNFTSGTQSIYYYIQTSFTDMKGYASTDRHLWDVDFKSGYQYFAQDSIKLKETTLTMSATSSSYNLHLFVRPNGNNPFTGRLYSLKIYDYLSNNGDCIRDFVPCYRKSDSVAGLWDAVNKSFYTNDGTGTFVVGPDV